MWEEKEGRIVGRKYEELIDDFVSMHGVELMSSVAVVGEGERNVVMVEDGCHAARWNSVWELIPSTRSSVLDFGTASNPSLVTIVCICLHYKKSHKTHLASSSDEESHKAHLMPFLARLIVATLDQCAMLLRSCRNSFDLRNVYTSSDIMIQVRFLEDGYLFKIITVVVDVEILSSHP